MKRLISLLLATFLLIQACQEDRELINGTISVAIQARTQYGKSIPLFPDAEVSLYENTKFIASSLTNDKGRCQFDQVPYGKYNLRVMKVGFADSYGGVNLVHVGGYCPSYTDLWIFEVPTYELFIDSIRYVKTDAYFFLHLRPDTVYPQSSFRVFAGSDKNVSISNYISAGKGHLAIWYPNYPTVIATYGRIYSYDFDSNIEQLKNDTIFMRIYPHASSQGYGIMEFSPESVGKPSNVIKFLWKDLVQ
jgi:hypothetical protein